MTSTILASPALAMSRLLEWIGSRAGHSTPTAPDQDWYDPADPFGFDAPPVLMRAFDDCRTRNG